MLSSSISTLSGNLLPSWSKILIPLSWKGLWLALIITPALPAYFERQKQLLESVKDQLEQLYRLESKTPAENANSSI